MKTYKEERRIFLGKGKIKGCKFVQTSAGQNRSGYAECSHIMQIFAPL